MTVNGCCPIMDNLKETYRGIDLLTLDLLLLRTSRLEINESVIIRRKAKWIRDWEGQNQAAIELNDALVRLP